ncbi:hypothetical protein BUALT_Bualt17G0075300 [Buddleja alternifolia]|uniref:F-box domain-containing protein n=1 Tax=Buddleja alternifolia TaxID=168488 RepID=A0AAV6W7F4_9LAMI|nr:hypothetical protein BUALT_Bualt17G0075300 [Buddleja alternifolia]
MEKIIKDSTNMKRATTMVGRISKKKKRVVTTIDRMPKELIGEVLARVASASFTDMFSAKLSCKTFHQVAEDRYIYKHVSLNNFPIVAWSPLNEMQQVFLTKCEECENPNLIFRQAVVDYFGGEQLESRLIIRRLDKAIQLGHIGAFYLRCILLIFSGNNELKERGVESLINMKKCKKYGSDLRAYRDELIGILNMIWVENSVLEDRPICCIMRDDHEKRRIWADINEDEATYCEACDIDNEIRLISSFFPHL